MSPAPMIATRFFDDFAEDPLVADEDLSLRYPQAEADKNDDSKTQDKIDKKNKKAINL